MDRTQFINLVNDEQEQLRKFLLALCMGNHDAADDIAQEALVKAYLSSSGYQDKGKFTAWLYKIAYNTFLDHKKSRRTSVPLDTCQHLSDTTIADKSFQYQDLYRALDELPPKERTSILLFYIKGYSVKEISKIVECNEDAVKKQLSRGREHLKQKMGNRE